MIRRAGPRPSNSLLAVPLNSALRSEGGLIGTPTGISQGTTLPEKIPHSVECDLKGPQPGLVVFGETLADVLLFETLLFLGQISDPGDDLVILHRCLPWSPSPSARASD